MTQRDIRDLSDWNRIYIVGQSIEDSSPVVTEKTIVSVEELYRLFEKRMITEVFERPNYRKEAKT